MKGEFEWIKKLAEILPPASARVEVGIGDDTAVLKPISGKLLVTVDTLVEGVHFDFAFCTPQEVGKKALAVNLSDIAAMGGTPRAALVSLGVSKTTSINECQLIYEGLSEEAKKYGVDIVGGNISQSPERLFLSITLLGEAEGAVIKRRGAKPGDLIFVTGTLGESAAGLALLRKSGRKAISNFPNLTSRYLKPEARCEWGQGLAQFQGITSLIDISDGLSSELWHLSEASKSAFFIKEAALIASDELSLVSKLTETPVLQYQLDGGGDYELLGTCSPERFDSLRTLAKKVQVPLSEIGKVEEGEGVFLISKNGSRQSIFPSGWNHLPTNKPK